MGQRRSHGSPALPGKLEVGWSRGFLVPDWLQSCCLEILLKIQNCQCDSLKEGDPRRAIFHLLRNSDTSQPRLETKRQLFLRAHGSPGETGFPRMDTPIAPF